MKISIEIETEIPFLLDESVGEILRLGFELFSNFGNLFFPIPDFDLEPIPQLVGLGQKSQQNVFESDRRFRDLGSRFGRFRRHRKCFLIFLFHFQFENIVFQSFLLNFSLQTKQILFRTFVNFPFEIRTDTDTWVISAFSFFLSFFLSFLTKLLSLFK